MRHKVVAPKFIPGHLPVNSTAIGWLLMDRFNSPGWVHGMFWTIMAVFWVAAIALIWTQDGCDPFKRDA